MGEHDRPLATQQNDPEPERLTLGELTDAAGVTVRTVRYYIAEGLLPPPASAGPRSYYTRGHLNRLRLIARMKGAYLPLKEIRRQLAGLDDAAVRALVERETQPAAPELDSASAYLDQILGTPKPGGEPEPPFFRAQHLRSIGEERIDRYDLSAMARDRQPEPPPTLPAQPGPLPIGVATPLPGVSAPPPADDVEPDSWRRVRLADDAELLIRDAAYQKRRDRIDWLIRWARKVFC